VLDKSNGYEAIAEAFTRARRPSIGPATVRKWTKRLQPGASILDIGCGYGVPISEALLQEGFAVYGVDASETFDAVVAWGLMFILSGDTQRSLIGKVARVLNRPGHLLFTAPRQACSWLDGMTGLPSISLGHDAYAHELAAHGLVLVGNDEDEGGNYYYLATTP
jgi:hypothetical protein